MIGHLRQSVADYRKHRSWGWSRHASAMASLPIKIRAAYNILFDHPVIYRATLGTNPVVKIPRNSYTLVAHTTIRADSIASFRSALNTTGRRMTVELADGIYDLRDEAR